MNPLALLPYRADQGGNASHLAGRVWRGESLRRRGRAQSKAGRVAGAWEHTSHSQRRGKRMGAAEPQGGCMHGGPWQPAAKRRLRVKRRSPPQHSGCGSVQTGRLVVAERNGGSARGSTAQVKSWMGRGWYQGASARGGRGHNTPRRSSSVGGVRPQAAGLNNKEWVGGASEMGKVLSALLGPHTQPHDSAPRCRPGLCFQ